MAHFIVEYADLPESGPAREAHRGEHIAYRIGLGEKMLMAGPLLDDAGQSVGSLVLIEADDRQAAEETALRDPFMAHGVFRLVSVRPYRVAAILGTVPR
jgi:uncharacterized protein